MEIVRLIADPMTDASILSSFSCGIEEMDVFVHNNLQKSIDGHFCKAYVIYNVYVEADAGRGIEEGKEIVAFFALNFDSLEVENGKQFEILYPKDGSNAEQIDISIEYEEIFKDKTSFPALEISYLAVQKEYQGNYIGTSIIEIVKEKAKKQAIAGCQFITVMAYDTPEEGYSAVPFYRKQHFQEIDGGGKNTKRMYTPLYVYDD